MNQAWEVAAMCAGRPLIDTELVTAARRDELSMYRDQMRPHHITVFTTTIWRNRHGVFGCVLARTGRGARFRRRELEIHERLLPAIRISEALLLMREEARESHFEQSFVFWSESVRLSRREREVAALVARGLHNPEIAALLEVSLFTVRNQLTAIFRKAGVSTRAELVFAIKETCASDSQSVRKAITRGLEYPWMDFVRGEGGHD